MSPSPSRAGRRGQRAAVAGAVFWAVGICGGAASDEDSRQEDSEARFLEVFYKGASLQPLVAVEVGGQKLNLVFDASSGNTVVFVKEHGACIPASYEPCYSADKASETLKICSENNDEGTCSPRESAPYKCEKYLNSLEEARPSHDALIIDGIVYVQRAVEAKDAVEVRLSGGGGTALGWPSAPVRLLVRPMRPHLPIPRLPLKLFEGTSGILGASGPTLSCRNGSVWSDLLEREGATKFAIDLSPPPNATTRDSRPSRIVIGAIDRKYEDTIVWSEPKQTGDSMNDGMHEFLLYHLSLCKVDLLYNVSSSWLVIIDTSGPCLTLPQFLFDRVMSHAAVRCPFKLGDRAWGRLCSPVRGEGVHKLPTLSFQLRDVTGDPAPWLYLPLERLVFRNASGDELICIAREDGDPKRGTADMLYLHIAFGSFAMSAFYTVVDLKHHTIGLASKGDPVKEASDGSCAAAPECIGMQQFYPPLNICEDPDCSEYMFMSLDARARVCRWMPAVPGAFAVLLAALVVLDLLSHRLYKQAIDRARESCQ